MAAATAVTRYTMVLSPIKIEFIKCTMATTGDTVETSLSRALWAIAVYNDVDIASVKAAITGKSIAVTGSAVGSSQAVQLIVVGF